MYTGGREGRVRRGACGVADDVACEGGGGVEVVDTVIPFERSVLRPFAR